MLLLLLLLWVSGMDSRLGPVSPAGPVQPASTRSARSARSTPHASGSIICVCVWVWDAIRSPHFAVLHWRLLVAHVNQWRSNFSTSKQYLHAPLDGPEQGRAVLDQYRQHQHQLHHHQHQHHQHQLHGIMDIIQIYRSSSWSSRSQAPPYGHSLCPSLELFSLFLSCVMNTHSA